MSESVREIAEALGNPLNVSVWETDADGKKWVRVTEEHFSGFLEWRATLPERIEAFGRFMWQAGNGTIDEPNDASWEGALAALRSERDG